MTPVRHNFVTLAYEVDDFFIGYLECLHLWCVPRAIVWC